MGGASHRRHPTLYRPPARHLEMAVGSTRPYPGDIQSPKTVSVVRPELLDVTLDSGNMMLNGVGTGSTDLVVGDGEHLEVFTVHIE